tara:strand:- start:544 stop:693 length:150 start_codon:yes stop_codon:yes gene_type:complete
MTKYNRLTDIVEAALDERVSVKNVLVVAAGITIGAIVLRLVQKRKRDGN